jgi:hypothetical protein
MCSAAFAGLGVFFFLYRHNDLARTWGGILCWRTDCLRQYGVYPHSAQQHSRMNRDWPALKNGAPEARAILVHGHVL